MNSKAAFTGAIAAIVSSLTIMLLLHSYGPAASFMPMSGSYAAHANAMTEMWSQMGWLMALGPVTMILFFGGILTLVMLLVRSLVRRA